MNRTKCALIASLFLCRGNAFAQSVDIDKGPEPVAIMELGGAGSWNLKGGSSFGADLAAEVTPIENWLELEAGVTPLSPVTRQNGIPTFCSISLGPSLKKRSSCSALARSGFIRGKAA
jgi:hypothetical protein